MSLPIQPLIDALRNELQQYGEMLALLEQQQEWVLSRAPDEVVQSVGAIYNQGGVLEDARAEREQARIALARHLRMGEMATFSEIVPRVPEEYRPLLEALVQENNELLGRIQHRARQNHLLLTRSLDLMQRFMSSMFPRGAGSTYGGDGSRSMDRLGARSLYEVVA